MSKLRTLRAFVSERLTAAAEEIFVQFERTIAEYEEELCRSQKENQRKQQLLDAVLNPGILLAKSGERVQIPSSSPPNLGLNQEITETAQIKEEPEELSLSQEEEQQPGFVPEFSAVCVKTEESSLHQQTEHREETQEEDISSEPHFHFETEELTERSSDTDNDDDDDWKPSIRLAIVQMETETGGNHDNQVQNRDRSTAAQNSGQSSEYKSVPGTSAAVNNEDTLGTDEGSEGKKHQCPFCMKTFLGNSYLQTHMRVHTGERPYVCSICEKTFNQKSNLKTHLRTHTGEKPYSCIVCHKKFAQNHYLRTHMRTHTGERPYECSTCQRTFAEKGTLKTHMKTHTGERPFSCPLCNLKFTESYTLKTHMQTHNMQFSLG